MSPLARCTSSRPERSARTAAAEAWHGSNGTKLFVDRAWLPLALREQFDAIGSAVHGGRKVG